MKIMIEVSIGELIDKMTILEIKLDNISDETKLANVHHEYNLLKEVYVASINETATLLELSSQLKNINAAIWRIEDDIRNLERSKSFNKEFVEVARSVYRTNDERAAIKRKINELLDSKIVEEKSYSNY